MEDMGIIIMIPLIAWIIQSVLLVILVVYGVFSFIAIRKLKRRTKAKDLNEEVINNYFSYNVVHKSKEDYTQPQPVEKEDK